MSRNGAGTYSLPAGNPVVTGTVISSTWANTTLSDIATALTQSIAVDGQSPITANIPFNSFKATGLGAATIAGDAISYAQSGASLAGLTLTAALNVTGVTTLTGNLNVTGNASIVGQLLKSKSSSIASAATVDLSTATGNEVHITGSTGPITSFGTVQAGAEFTLIFDSTPSVTYNATSMIIPGAANVTVAANDVWKVISEGSGNWRITSILKSAGTPFTMTPITNALGANVNLNNTANYFDGPTVAQGTAGTWYVSGKVMVADNAGPAAIWAKLWDGTTVIDSGGVVIRTGTTGDYAMIPLCGFITNPAGNLRISVRDNTSTSGVIAFNQSGNSKDSSITAIRIA